MAPRTSRYVKIENESKCRVGNELKILFSMNSTWYEIGSKIENWEHQKTKTKERIRNELKRILKTQYRVSQLLSRRFLDFFSSELVLDGTSVDVGYTSTPSTPTLRSPRCLGKACCEACPIRFMVSGVGLSGGCKVGLTLKE